MKKKKVFSAIFLLFFIHCFIFSLEKNKSIVNQKDTYNSNFLFTISFSAGDINNIKIKTTYELTTFRTAKNNRKITIDVYGNNNTILPEIKNENKTIYIQSTANYVTRGDICNVVVHIPENKKFNNVTILSENQNEKEFIVPKINTETFLIYKNSADIKGTDISGVLTLQTKTGNIELDNIDVVQLYIKSEKGNVNINSFTGNYMYMYTTGNITADNVTCDLFDIKTVTGNISLAINKVPEGSSYIKSDSGQIQLFIPKTANFDISVYSAGGFFFDKKQKKRSSPRHEYTISYNRGGPVIYTATKSGNIELYDF